MTWWGPLLGLLGVLAGSTTTYLLGRRKATADADRAITEAAANIAEASDAQVRRMTGWLESTSKAAELAQAEAVGLRAELAAVRARVREVEAQLVALLAQMERERAASRTEISRLARGA